MLQYENILSQHDDLNAFITKRDIYYSTSFDDFSNDDTGFLEWISPKFYDSFKSVLEQAFTVNHIWKIAKLQKIKKVCTAEYAKKCDDMIIDVIDGMMYRVRKLQAKRTPEGLTTEQTVEKSFGEAWTNLVNYRAKSVPEISQEYGQLGLELGKYFLKREDIINAKKIMLSLKNINASQEVKYEIKINTPGNDILAEEGMSTGRIALSVIIAIIAIIRLIVALAR